MKDQLATRCRRIELFLETPQTDTIICQRLDCFYQVRQRASQPIEFPDHQDVASTTGLQRRRQPRPCGLGATRRIGEDALAAGGP